ncbi:hypothetical protein DL93DRAFT_2173645 [Clavulina sp. PMI_390]|nr:hypothetical protein DL93DRAFT_2173645 [Clavulina sp. PMI_390]
MSADTSLSDPARRCATSTLASPRVILSPHQYKCWLPNRIWHSARSTASIMLTLQEPKCQHALERCPTLQYLSLVATAVHHSSAVIIFWTLARSSQPPPQLTLSHPIQVAPPPPRKILASRT